MGPCHSSKQITGLNIELTSLFMGVKSPLFPEATMSKCLLWWSLWLMLTQQSDMFVGKKCDGYYLG